MRPPVPIIAAMTGATAPKHSVDTNGNNVVEYPRPTFHIDVDLSKNPIALNMPGFVGTVINSTTQICTADGVFVPNYLDTLKAMVEEMKAHTEHGKHFAVRRSRMTTPWRACVINQCW